MQRINAPRKPHKLQERHMESPGKRLKEQLAQAWLRTTFPIGYPTVIQSDWKGFYFQFKDSPKVYKLPWDQMRKGDYPDLTDALVT